MTQSSVDRLGTVLGDLYRTQSETQQNISSDDAGQTFNFEFTVPIAIQGTAVGVAKYLATTSFVLDHPVYGELNSSTLYINGGYASTTGAFFTFPGTFPMTFSGGTAGTVTLFTQSF